MGTHPRRRPAPAPLPEIEWIDDQVVDPSPAVPAGLVRVARLPPRPPARRTGPPLPGGPRGFGGPVGGGAGFGGIGPGFSVIDPAVHRRLRRPADAALEALERLHGELVAGPSTRRGSWALWGRRRAWLAFDDPVRGMSDEGCRMPARLRAPWSVRLVEVELVVEPWSASWTELRLQLAGHRSVWRLPHGYFDTAHPLMGSLRDALAARA